ncbi:MAG: sugar-binding protein [Phycisphaerae bacterium]|nr:sugar-binding protein [Phycisphaerae bacterium]MDD5380985.1 sugar-binding protein [Phycisphaerae bacterium]
MKTLKIMTIMFLLIFGLLSTVVAAKPASVMLREGLYAEEVEGNIDAAMEIYEQIIKDKSASRENVAQALYRQGMCCLKKKDDAGAKAVFAKLTAEYADQTEIIGKVKPLLDDLMNYDPADLMPPGTLVYVELGSPGEQIETLLNMLKGTPFENPLAAMGGGNMPGAGGGQKSPADIFAALLNPSMMAEFKKIKGMAVGVTAIRQNNPPAVAVLYPGKSDALRGLIMMALSMAGTPGEPLEGMQTLNIPNSAAAAYDDKVIIIAQPSEQLKWCVKQYKGTASEPTLASSNKSFAKISKKQRQSNVVTVWANVDEAYTQVLKTGQNPQDIFKANAIADFNNIDEFILTVSIEPNSLVSKANVLFKDGHHCIAYDIIRTPNINKAALESVPSEAIALVSVALSRDNVAQVDTVREKIQNVTGLDIGREIYANIEQVTIFAMPADGNSAGWGSFSPACLGLAVTSHNPEQTRQILAMLLGTVNAINNNQSSGSVDANAGKFKIGMESGKELYCYMEQVGNTTILSLNRGVVDASIAAVKSKNSVCTAGPLAPAVNKISPTTSKLVLVNVGGAIRMAGPAINIGSLSDEQRNQMNVAIEQLARSADRTTIEIRTDEQVNSFALNTSITAIPPLNEVFGPVSQIAGIANQVKAVAKSQKLRGTMAATIMPAATPPVIDGNEDDVWSVAPVYKLKNVIYAPPSSPNDIAADFRAMWDADNLYLLVDVTDDSLVNDTRPDQAVTLPTGSTNIPWWYDDCVEVYIDAGNSKSNQYGSEDAQYHFDWDRTSPTMGRHNEHGRMENIEFAMKTIEKGYRTEIKFPWATLGKKPSAGSSIGLDVHVNDDDEGGERDTKITWCDKQDTAWSNPQAFGNGELAGIVGWWKFDETEGTTAADGSGNNHNGTLIGNAKWAQGKIGGAIDLDGKGSFIQIADKSAFNIAGQVTVACWANIRSVPSEYMAIVTKGDGSWRLSTAQQGRKFHGSVNNYNSIVLDGSTEVTANEWHYVVLVYDNEEVRIYVDGRLDAAKLWKGGIAVNDFDVLIGENAEQKGRSFDGLIDDVRIYNYALKDSDIMALYNESAKQ